MKKVLLFLLVCCCTVASEVYAQPKGVDSTLYTYYRWCNDHIREPEVLFTADTMFRIAVEKNDSRMQCIALTFKADHYYFTNNLDSLKAWKPRVQAFARQQEQLTYYYFIWTRLILYYTKHSQYATAQYELKQFLAEAERDGYTSGIAQAYTQMAHIYSTKGVYAAAADYYCKAIEQINQGNGDKALLSNYYTQLASTYMDMGKYPEAAKALRNAEKAITLPVEIWDIRIHETTLLAKTGQIDKAKALFEQVRNNNDKYLTPSRMLEIDFLLAHKAGEHHKAIQTFSQLQAIYQTEGLSEAFYYDKFGSLASSYAALGDYKKAYENSCQQFDLYHKKVSSDNEQSLNEFATLFDVEQLNHNNAVLSQQAQEERLVRNRSIILGLVAILALAAFFIALLTRLNRRLAHAKRAAEQTSNMKSAFIRAVTHEINTPLNAIIGFSEMATTAPDNSPERESYIEIIRQNGTTLHKIVDDVLYISDMESQGATPDLTPVDINLCCRQCLEVAAADDREEVSIYFEAECNTLRANTSRLYLSKLLNELLSNALRFTKKGSITLSYTVEKHPGRIVFSVTDTGPGIPADQQDAIFDRFVKLDSFSQGMGLGLSVCRMIAQKLGGILYVDRTYTQGARFIFVLPLTE